MSNSDERRLAGNALQLLAKATLLGGEVPAYVDVHN